MRLLIVIPHFKTGGAQRLLADLIPSMALRDNMEITLLLYHKSEDSFLLNQVKQNPLIKIRALDIPVGRKDTFNPFVRWKAIRELRAYMRNADVCHVHLFSALYDASIAAKGLPVKLVFTNHNTYNRRRKYTFLRKFERWIYSRYYAIVCISPASARSLTEWLDTPCDDQRIQVIANGINLNAFNFYRKKDVVNSECVCHDLTIRLPESTSELFEMFENGRDESLQRRLKRAGISSVKDVFGRDGHAILMISRFIENKDHESLLKAFHILKTNPSYSGRIPADTFLVFAGDGGLINKSKDLAARLNLSGDVIFLGNRTDVPRLIAAASVGAQISHWEGFGLTACEILAGETPLVASDVRGMAEIVRESAYLAAPESPESIAAAIADVLAPETPETLNETLMRQYDGVLTARRYDIRHTLDSYIRLYHKLVGS